MYLADLTPYPRLIGSRIWFAVGWLTAGHPYPQGDVGAEVQTLLATRCAAPDVLTRGFHECSLCLDPFPATGSGEIRLQGVDGVGYVAPTLIEQVVAQKEWFDPHLCEAIQPHVDNLMPDAWTSKEGRPIYPVAYWLEAMARGAQLQLSRLTGYLPDLKFGLFFLYYFPKLIIEVRDTTNRIMQI